MQYVGEEEDMKLEILNKARRINSEVFIEIATSLMRAGKVW